MSSYGRHFEFRIPPAPFQRNARYITPATGDQIRIGAPVEVTATEQDTQGRLPVVLATGGTPPRNGITGILVYEYAPSAFAGSDPSLVTFSNERFAKAPLNAPVQLVSGGEVKVVFRNVGADDSFVGNVSETGLTTPAVTFVAGLGATPTLQVGDFLEPGAGNDTDGYWTEAGTAADAWFVVTAINLSRAEVEARMLF